VFYNSTNLKIEEYKMSNNSISVNIWDDYHDDGYVPEGKIQETYAYIESDLEDEDCKNVLELIKENIEQIVKPEWSLEMYLNYYDSAKVYPNLVGTEHEYCLYKRWQLQMKHLTHEAREYLVEVLQTRKLQYMGKSLKIYSES
jgi:hypothetical protein